MSCCDSNDYNESFVFFRYGFFSVVAGEFDLSTDEGTEQEIDVDEVVIVSNERPTTYYIINNRGGFRVVFLGICQTQRLTQNSNFMGYFRYIC